LPNLTKICCPINSYQFNLSSDAIRLEYSLTCLTTATTTTKDHNLILHILSSFSGTKARSVSREKTTRRTHTQTSQLIVHNHEIFGRILFKWCVYLTVSISISIPLCSCEERTNEQHCSFLLSVKSHQISQSINQTRLASHYCEHQHIRPNT